MKPVSTPVQWRDDMAGRPEPVPWRILFVDDDRQVLDGLRRMLRPLRDVWQLSFTTEPHGALELMAGQGVDVIVTDMRMPEMDGVRLLREVRARHPGTARIVLSGYANRDLAVHAAALAHQCLAKPCEPDFLISVLRRLQKAHQRLADAELARAITGLVSITGSVAQLEQVRKLASGGGGELESLVRSVELDTAITARVLQLVSSSFFGAGREVSTVAEGVSFLGSGVLGQLAAIDGALVCTADAHDSVDVGALSRHALRVSRLAARIAVLEGCDEAEQAVARIGGQLHDVGRLALLAAKGACERPDAPHVPADPASGGSWPGHAAHAAAGAYLTALWGLPDNIVDVIASQCNPVACRPGEFSAAVAVHAADVLIHELDGEEDCRPALATDCLDFPGMVNRMRMWMDEAVAFPGGAWRSPIS